MSIVDVNLLVIATNKYICYLEGLLDSADELFLKEHRVFYNIFTDRVADVRTLLHLKPYYNNVRLFEIEHKPFPYSTLYRFHFFQQYMSEMPGDFFFYIDADCLIMEKVSGQDVLSPRTAVQHCGFVNSRGTYEENPNSTSFVRNNEGDIYYGGGFWGFSKAEFVRVVNAAVTMIDTDYNNKITPVWHDESVLNRILIDKPPTKVLDPSFHYPENNEYIYKKWAVKGKRYKCIVLLLDKDHKTMRA